jgi:hypothetical protein
MALEDFLQPPAERLKSTSFTITDTTRDKLQAIADDLRVSNSKVITALIKAEYDNRFEEE